LGAGPYPASVTPNDNDGQSASKPQAVVEIELDNPADSGAAVGRDADGRAIFADGGLAGERVLVELVTQKKRFARGRVIEVLDPSPERIEARCATHRAGCGGCDLAHASGESQAAIKQHVVRDALERIGRIDAAEIDDVFVVRSDAPTIPDRYRTTVRAAINDGKAGYRQRASHDPVWASQCLVVHERLEELLVEGTFGASAGDEVVLRVSDSTDQRIALVDGSTADVRLPDDVTVVSRSDTDARRALHVIENAGGRDWQVSADSFFQSRARPQRFVLVACDTGSLGRDVGLLYERGYTLESIQIVDAFRDTSHVETIVGLRS